MTPQSDVPTLPSVREDASEEEREELRFAPSHNREQWDFEKIDPKMLRSMPRFSTSGDLPFMGDNSSASRIRSMKMSSDELAETFSSAGSSDEESIINSRYEYLRWNRSDEENLKFRKVVTNSSTKLKKMGSKLRRVPSNLLLRTRSAPTTATVPSDHTPEAVRPTDVSRYEVIRSTLLMNEQSDDDTRPRRKRSVTSMLESTFRLKENSRPQAVG